MKIYIGDSIKSKFRWQLFPLIKPFYSAIGKRTTKELLASGIQVDNITFVQEMEAADIAVLPMSWNHYYDKKKLSTALDFVEEATKYEKQVWSFTSGDFGVKMPFFKNLTVFRLGGLMSKLPHTHKGMPSFIKDPLPIHFNSSEIKILPYSQIPEVSFCGQANNSRINGAKEIGKTALRNFKSKYLNRSLDPQPVISTSILRANLLSSIVKHSKVETNFILRDKYRAGATTQLEREKTTRDFHENLNNSPYVLCVRGAGNFSIRFYEALALGRIPIFVDTDCLLPLADVIDWKKHVVWISEKDKHKIGQLLVDFHSQFNEEGFIQLQKSNRELWEKRLTLTSFFNFQ